MKKVKKHIAEFYENILTINNIPFDDRNFDHCYRLFDSYIRILFEKLCFHHRFYWLTFVLNYPGKRNFYIYL